MKNTKQMFNPIDVKCGQIIKLLRKKNRISQSELADAIGLTFQQVQKYERGANRISVSRLFDIAKFLTVHPSDLLPEVTRTRGRPASTLVVKQAHRISQLESTLKTISETAKNV